MVFDKFQRSGFIIALILWNWHHYNRKHLDFIHFTTLSFVGRYEDAFNRFVDEINALASYQWWEGSVYSILCVITYPLAWSWRQWCRKKKMQHLREYVRSEYDHACLRSCRSRALYEGLKVCSGSLMSLAFKTQMS